MTLPPDADLIRDRKARSLYRLHAFRRLGSPGIFIARELKLLAMLTALEALGKLRTSSKRNGGPAAFKDQEPGQTR